MSTEANAALAWPIEPTEFAHIGDQVAHDLNQPDLFESPISDVHYGSYVWLVGEDAPPLSLCGATIPGGIFFRYPDEVDARTGIQFDYPEAGMWAVLGGDAWIVRPFRGDWLSDPRVHVEGADTGYWWLDADTGSRLADPFGPAWNLEERDGEQHHVENHEENEPDDYDGYVDYVCERSIYGRSPGLDDPTEEEHDANVK